MTSRDNQRLRLVSPGPAKSDGNSSMRVVEASSNRAQSTTPQSRAQSPESSSLDGRRRRLASSQTAPLRNRSSMEDDLRGLDSRAAPQRGVKRSRSEVSDDEDSADEPGPKRDRLLEELCGLQAVNREDDNVGDSGGDEQEETVLAQNPLMEQDLPLRLQRQVDGAPRDDVDQHDGASIAPDNSLGKSNGEGSHGVSRHDERTPPAEP